VQDVPDAPAAPVRTGTFTGGQLTLSYAAPQANNSPLTRFRLTGMGSAGGSYSKDCGLTTVCTLTDLDPEQTFRFSVVATNGIGDSAPSASSESYSADFVPAPPTGVTVTPNPNTPGAIDVRWNAVPKPDRGSAVLPTNGYVVEYTGGASGTQVASGTSTTILGPATSTSYEVRVYARNRAQVSSEADWARSGPAAGTSAVPPVIAAPSPVLAPDGSGINVTWTPGTQNGGAELAYELWRGDRADGGSCAAGSVKLYAGKNEFTFKDVPPGDGTTYTYSVRASNGVFCSSAGAGVTSLKKPGAVTGAVSLQHQGNTGDFDAEVESRLVVDTGTADVFEYRVRTEGGVERTGTLETRTIPTTTYGQKAAIDFRGCRVGGGNRLCGDWSGGVSLTPVATRANVTVCNVGQDLQVREPVNDKLKPILQVTYFGLLYPLGKTTDEENRPYTATGEVPDGAFAVEVKATVNDIQDPGAGRASCS
jgi:hypothetical protein